MNVGKGFLDGLDCDCVGDSFWEVGVGNVRGNVSFFGDLDVFGAGSAFEAGFEGSWDL